MKPVLTYEQGKGTGIFYIPAENEFVDENEYVISDIKRDNVGLTFFKTTKDSIFYSVDIYAVVDDEDLIDDVSGVVENTFIDFKRDRKCTNDNQPSFIINKSGAYIIRLINGNVVRTYKLILDLRK